MKEIALPSGNKLSLVDADFEDVMDLQELITSYIEILPENSLKKGLDTDLISVLKNLPKLIVKKENRELILKCGKNCSIIEKGTGTKINLIAEYFNKPEHRIDYYPIIKEVAEYALSPFIKGLLKIIPERFLKMLKG